MNSYIYIHSTNDQLMFILLQCIHPPLSQPNWLATTTLHWFRHLPAFTCTLLHVCVPLPHLNNCCVMTFSAKISARINYRSSSLYQPTSVTSLPVIHSTQLQHAYNYVLVLPLQPSDLQPCLSISLPVFLLRSLLHWPRIARPGT